MLYVKQIQNRDIQVHGANNFRDYKFKRPLHSIPKAVSKSMENKEVLLTNHVSQFYQEQANSQELCKGGYGKIYVVKPMNDLPALAMKVIPVSSTDQEIKNSKQNNEIQYLQRLQGSRNIVKLYKHDISSSETKIWMELCSKGSIEDELALYPYQSIPEDRVRTIMKAVFQTLAQCHDQSIIHGDIKPGNFLNTDDGRIVAIDFGNASTIEEFEHTKGTPHYMAPEQLNSETCTKSDMWSAGVMMYRLLSNRFPFDDRQNPYQPSLYAIWREIFSKDLTFKRSIWNEISVEGKDLLSQLLEKDVSKRLSALEALQHPWFKKSKESFINNSDIDTQMARYVRYQMYPELKKDMLRYVSYKFDMTPEELSSSPNNSLRNSCEAKKILEEYFQKTLIERLDKVYKDPYDHSHVKGLIGNINVTENFEALYQLWMKHNLPTYAFQ